MKFLIWAITGFLVLLWTGAAAMLAAGVNWLAASVADPAIRTIPSPAQWPVPEWLAVWVPSGVIELAKAGLVGSLASLVSSASWLAPALGWLPVAIWIVWGVVLVLMLALAAGAYLLMARSRRVRPVA